MWNASPSFHPFTSPLFHYHAFHTGPQTICLHPEELRHRVRRAEEGNQGLTQSLNPKDDPKEPSVKQARMGSLTPASHLSSDSVRLSFWCTLRRKCLTDTQTKPGGFTVIVLGFRQVRVTASLQMSLLRLFL